jgi:hypothetical protein
MGFSQPDPVVTNCFKEPERSDDVRLDEVFGAVDRPVYVAFSREIDYGSWLVFAQQLIKKLAVTNVTLNEVMPARVMQTRKILQIPGVGESVEIDNFIVALIRPIQYEIAADETGPSGDKNIAFCIH